MTTFEIISWIFFIIGAIVIIYDRKRHKLTVNSFTIELIQKGENRETIIFRLMTSYKLSIKEANMVYDKVDLSGLADKNYKGFANYKDY
jgi:hypothetical protein